MKVIKSILFAFLFIIISFNVYAANKMYWAIGLTGTTGTLDSFDGTSLADGDGAIVVANDSGVYKTYIYRLVNYASSPPAESSPSYIVPNSNASNKVWVLTTFYSDSIASTRGTNPGCLTLYEGTGDGDDYQQICGEPASTGYPTGNTGIWVAPPGAGKLSGTCTVTHNYGATTTTKALTTAESNCSYFSATNASGAVAMTLAAAVPGKTYTVYNNTGYALTFGVAGQTGVSIANGKNAFFTTGVSNVIQVYVQP